MTQNRKQTKAIRLRMTETGESYMQARRQLDVADASGEPHYVLHRVRGAIRVEGGRQRPVVQDHQGAWWGYGGGGPNRTAKAILDDALGVDADRVAFKAFSSEVLARLDGDRDEERLTVAEVRAWWEERLPAVTADAEANAGRDWEPVDLRDLAKTLLDGEPRFRWLKERRENHPPDFGPESPA